VERLACVDVPALPLQLFVARHPNWRGEPAAVVDRDAPHGVVLASNERARREGVLSGLRYSAALALCPALRAAEVSEEEVGRGVARLADLLRRFSPAVEPCRDDPGVFWIDLSGLELLHPSRVAWAKAVRVELRAAGFESAVVAGFRRFSTYAIAKALHGARVLVFDDSRAEDELARRVPLSRLAQQQLPDAVRDDLDKLAVRTVGDLLRLPVESVRLRFGAEVGRVHALASGALAAPLEPERVVLAPQAAVDLDFPLRDVESILAVAELLTRPLLVELARRGEAVRALALRLRLENGAASGVAIEPAEPTLDFAALARLLRLRLEGLKLARDVERAEVELASAPASVEQLRLFAQRPGRDPKAALGAFAALRAAFGDDVVVRAELRPTHLPEARFAWERLERLAPPRPRACAEPSLVRRLYAKPVRLPTRSRHEEDGWMLRGITHGPVTHLFGPYFLSGGWWRAQVERDYYFAEMQSGELFWIYFDRARRRWFLQGSVS
jgi:protein ImuB